jgi:hypothetical protein
MAQLRPIPGTPPNLTAALKYGAKGVRIFPCGTDKRPLIADWLNAASADENQIRQWWADHPKALAGLPTKHLDLLVIDCGRHGNGADGVAAFAAMVAEHGALPDHPIVTTPNKGEHHFFRQPADFKIGNKPFAPGIDTRGYKPDNHGGYVIAPGSELPDGRRWKPYKGALSIKSLPQTDTPIWLADMLREKEAPKPPAVVPTLPPTNREEKWAQGALDNIAREIAVTGEGDKNSALNRTAFRMGTMVARGWIGEATVTGRPYDAADAGTLRNPSRTNVTFVKSRRRC